MYPAQTYLNQNKFAFLCCEEAEMKLAGSWCHQYHLYVLKWITDKGFALLQEKGPNVFAFKYRIKWNAYPQCGTSFWLPVWRRRAEKKPLISTQTLPPSSFFFFFYLLLKQMRPIVGNFCGALNVSMVTLTEINAFNLLLWYIGDAIQQPVGSSRPSEQLHDETRSGFSTLACFVGLWLSHRGNRVGSAVPGPPLSSLNGWKKNGQVKI